MKFGMNLLLWSGDLTDELLPVLEMLKKTGYDGVELPIFDADPKSTPSGASGSTSSGSTARR